MGEGVSRAQQKHADTDMAARALFETTKASIPELDEVEWDTMPIMADDHPMKGKKYYIREVMPAVEALWRAGRLCVESDLKEEIPKFVSGGVIDARCGHSTCDRDGVYWMVGVCYNCGTQNLLIMYSLGHRATDEKCPVCGCGHKAHPLRLPAPGEIPLGLEAEMTAKGRWDD